MTERDDDLESMFASMRKQVKPRLAAEQELDSIRAALGVEEPDPLGELDAATRRSLIDAALEKAATGARARFGLPQRQLAIVKQEPAPLVPISEVQLDNHQTGEIETWWLPKPARDWCEAVSAANKAPRNLAVAACMCAAATVLQGRVRVTWKPGVSEPLSLYWFVFSATGTRKTTILLRAMRAVLAYQQALADQAEKDAKVIENKRRRLEAQLRRLRGQKHGSKLSEGHQEWLGEIKQVELELDALVTPLSPEWSQSDVNPSLLPKLLQHNHQAEGIARLSIMVSEGAFLHNLMGRHQGAPILEVALGAINGEPMQFVRASKVGDEPVKIRLPHTYMTMCQLLQPHLLDVLKSSEVSDTGLAGRCIVEVLPSEPVKPDWSAPPVPDAVQQAYDAWLQALITEDLPDVVDLTLDAATGQAVRSLYESIEADGSGWSQRATGIICRLAAIVDIGNLVADRMANGKSVQRGAPDNNFGGTQSLGTSHIPKGIHVVAPSEYDWLDDFGVYDSEHLGAERICGDVDVPLEKQLPNHDETRNGDVGTEHGAEGTGAVGIIKYLSLFIHHQRLQLVRSLDRPSDSVGSLANRVLLRLRAVPTEIVPTNSGVKVRDCWKAITPSKRPSMDQFYAALEELEQSGAIEWIPDSIRKKGRDARYRSFRVLVRASHLEAVKPKE